jgi:hypothetical protein
LAKWIDWFFDKPGTFSFQPFSTIPLFPCPPKHYFQFNVIFPLLLRDYFLLNYCFLLTTRELGSRGL